MTNFQGISNACTYAQPTSNPIGETEDYTLRINSPTGFLSLGNQNLCSPANPANITFSSLPPQSLNNYYWYYQDGLIAQPTGTSTAGWTYITNGTSATSYDPPAGLTINRTYACFIRRYNLSMNLIDIGWATNVRQIKIGGKFCQPSRVAVDGEIADDVQAGQLDASLSQNIPNPFSSETVISCFVPETSAAARLQIFSMDGRNVLDIELTEKGRQDIQISRKQLLGAGIYQYRLFHSGKMEPAKRLVVTD
jgi:hypothetical protein